MRYGVDMTVEDASMILRGVPPCGSCFPCSFGGRRALHLVPCLLQGTDAIGGRVRVPLWAWSCALRLLYCILIPQSTGNCTAVVMSW